MRDCNILLLNGSSEKTGEKYGRLMAKTIRKNIALLIERIGIEIIEGINDVPLDDKDFIKWEKEQEETLREIAPYLLEEMEGIAAGAGVSYREVLLLNLRAWHYRNYTAKTGGCSSLAVTLRDGTVACTGALDDPAELYCGPVHVVPDEGYSFISFPIAGTVWGNRGMNNRGLAISTSSQGLPGLERLPKVINMDIAQRMILQTCSTSSEVKQFCRKHAFSLNILCVDKNSDIFCAHQTAGGCFEYPAVDGYAVLTNHIIDDRLMFCLNEKGVRIFTESETTRLRRGNLLDFAARRNRKCTGGEVRNFIEDRRNGSPAAICHKGTVVLTYSNPQACEDTLWINYLGEDKNKTGFTPVKL